VEPLLRSDYLPPSFLLPEIELDFKLAADETIIKSKLKLARQAPNADLILDGEHMSLRSLVVNGNVLNSDQYEVKGMEKSPNCGFPQDSPVTPNPLFIGNPLYTHYPTC
jgi:aminopeptidase N